MLADIGLSKDMLVYCTPDLYRKRFLGGYFEEFGENKRQYGCNSGWATGCRHKAEEGERTLNLNTVLLFFEGAFPAGRSYGEPGALPGRF